MSDLEHRLRSALEAYRDQTVAPDDLLLPSGRPRLRRPSPRLQLLAAAVVVITLAVAAIAASMSSRTDEEDLDVAVGGGTATAAEFDAAAGELCASIERGADAAVLGFDTAEAVRVVSRSRTSLIDQVWSAMTSLPRPADERRQIALGRAAATLRAAERLFANAATQADGGDLEAAAVSLRGGDERLFHVATLLGVEGDGGCAAVGRR